MTYVNNWLRPITLGAGVTTLALDLPDGQYRLTLADSASTATRWEIVDATVAAGTATLTRAREGTLDQAWPSGSVIYNAITAGALNELLERLASLEQRVTALEPDPVIGHLITIGEDGPYLGFVDDPNVAQIGGVEPIALTIPGIGARQLMAALLVPGNEMFMLAISGGPIANTLTSVEVDGLGTLLGAAATYNAGIDDPGAVWQWSGITGAPWAAGEQRRMTLVWGGGNGGNELTDSSGQVLTDSAGQNLTATGATT